MPTALVCCDDDDDDDADADDDVTGRTASGAQTQRPFDPGPPQRHDAFVRGGGATGGAAGRVAQHPPVQPDVCRQRRVQLSPVGSYRATEPGRGDPPHSDR